MKKLLTLGVLMMMSIPSMATSRSVWEQDSISSVSSKKTQSDFGLSLDLGYATSKLMTLNIGAQFQRLYLGLSAGICVDRPIKGKCYDSTMSWDKNTFGDPLKDSGDFKDFSIGVDVGYMMLNNSLCVGGGLGLMQITEYKQYFDYDYILDRDGWYHLTNKKETKVDPKVFANYYFNAQNPLRFYIHAQYSVQTQFGVGVGLAFSM